MGLLHVFLKRVTRGVPPQHHPRGAPIYDIADTLRVAVSRLAGVLSLVLCLGSIIWLAWVHPDSFFFFFFFLFVFLFSSTFFLFYSLLALTPTWPPVLSPTMRKICMFPRTRGRPLPRR
jgi:hypothetical protein